MNKQTIYVCGWPRSGTTWLTRLLGDVLNCPTGGAVASIDNKEIATEGQDRPNQDVIVRKGHFRLVDDVDCNKVAFASHQLAWRCLGDDRVVFIVRDPRDVIISNSHYWQFDTEYIIKKKFQKGYVEFMTNWYNADFDGLAKIRYEELLDRTEFCIRHLFTELGLKQVNNGHLLSSVKRQSFQSRLKYTHNNIDKLPHGEKHYKFLRVGKSRQWKQFPEVDRLAKKHFGEIMKMWGYD